MRNFFETTFGPTELDIVETAFMEWMSLANVTRDTPKAELAAAIVINLFREGNDTVPAMRGAIAAHHGLNELRHA